MSRQAKMGTGRKDAGAGLGRRACLKMVDGEPLAFVGGPDDAIVGVVEVDGEPRVVYDQGRDRPRADAPRRHGQGGRCRVLQIQHRRDGLRRRQRFFSFRSCENVWRSCRGNPVRRAQERA